jgi:hypothetical protein
MCDPTGFRFQLVANNTDSPRLMGDEVAYSPGQRLIAEFPVPCRIRLLNSGKSVMDQVSDTLDVPVPGTGVYRVEGWLTLDGEERPWIYSNPVYVR